MPKDDPLKRAFAQTLFEAVDNIKVSLTGRGLSARDRQPRNESR